MKKFILPVAVVLMAAGAAFATKAAKSSKAVIDAYRIDAVTGHCIDAEQKCSEFGGELCTWEGDNSSQLYAEPISETMCGSELYKVQ